MPRRYILVLTSLVLLALFSLSQTQPAIFWAMLPERLELTLIEWRDQDSLPEKDSGKTLLAPKFIAHAGGEVFGLKYTNSLEALNSNYQKGFRWFEIDFEWTTDSALVLLHDWDETLENLFKAAPGRRSLSEFRALRTQDITQMDLTDLAKWIQSHPDVVVVTDVKFSNLEALTLIKQTHPELSKSLVPQIYAFWEYAPVRALGFNQSILTLYRSNYSDEAVLRFLENHSLFALTTWYHNATPTLISGLAKKQVPLLVHTVNDPKLYEQLLRAGVYGIYTDNLLLN